MKNQGVIDIEGTYPVVVYAILPIATVYIGMFLAVSNHYVLRPKMEAFLQRASISSSLAKELIIDAVSNLSFISYAFSAYFLMEPTDYPIRLLHNYNMHWLTACLAIVMYMKIRNNEVVSKAVILKNGFFLGLCFVNILYHYFAQSTLLSLPVILIGLYLINLILNSNEDKYIQFIYQFLQLKMAVPLKPSPQILSKRPSLQYLSKNYPVSRFQLDEKLKKIEKKKANKPQFKAGRTRKQQINNQIGNLWLDYVDTKVVAKQRLMEICLSIHLSILKKEEDDIKALKDYIGFMNGPMPGKFNHQRQDKLAFRERKSYYHPKNKQKTGKSHKIDYSQQKEGQKISENKDKKEQILENTSNGLVQKHNLQIQQEPHYEVYDKDESFLFYVFPVKLFESTRVISIIFSIFLNLGFGIMLDYCQNVMNNLTYGRFSELLLAALLLPIIPEVSAIDYFNAMTLASIWKYGICGLFAFICIVANQHNQLYGSWQLTSYFQYQTIIQLVILILSYYLVFSTKNRFKFLIILFFLALAANVGVTYLSIKN